MKLSYLQNANLSALPAETDPPDAAYLGQSAQPRQERVAGVLVQTQYGERLALSFAIRRPASQVDVGNVHLGVCQQRSDLPHHSGHVPVLQEQELALRPKL